MFGTSGTRLKGQVARTQGFKIDKAYFQDIISQVLIMSAYIEPSREAVLLSTEGHWRDICVRELTVAGNPPNIREPEIDSFPLERAASEAYILPVCGPSDPVLNLVGLAVDRGNFMILVLAGSRVEEVGFISSFKGAAFCMRKSLDFTPVVEWLRDPIGFAERQNRNLR